MFILNQNRDIIVNFNSIQRIEIEAYGTHIKGVKKYKILAGNIEGYSILLGKYDTKEKAIEIMDDIWNYCITFKYYEMP